MILPPLPSLSPNEELEEEGEKEEEDFMGGKPRTPAQSLSSGNSNNLPYLTIFSMDQVSEKLSLKSPKSPREKNSPEISSPKSPREKNQSEISSLSSNYNSSLSPREKKQAEFSGKSPREKNSPEISSNNNSTKSPRPSTTIKFINFLDDLNQNENNKNNKKEGNKPFPSPLSPRRQEADSDESLSGSFFFFSFASNIFQFNQLFMNSSNKKIIFPFFFQLCLFQRAYFRL